MVGTFERTCPLVVTAVGTVFNDGNVEKFENVQNVGGRGSEMGQKFLRKATFRTSVDRTKSPFPTVGTALESLRVGLLNAQSKLVAYHTAQFISDTFPQNSIRPILG